MLRTTMAKAYIKRTFRPLYGWTQMTPKSVFLDPAWTSTLTAADPAWPGMVYMKTAGEQVKLCDATGAPYGFGALYVGGDGINEPLDSGINSFAVWVLGPDAEAEVLAPAFDTNAAWSGVDQSTGTEVLLYVGTVSGTDKGKLTLAATASHSTDPVARLLKVNSATKITIGGLR
jgi:hypothetical protein